MSGLQRLRRFLRWMRLILTVASACGFAALLLGKSPDCVVLGLAAAAFGLLAALTLVLLETRLSRPEGEAEASPDTL